MKHNYRNECFVDLVCESVRTLDDKLIKISNSDIYWLTVDDVIDVYNAIAYDHNVKPRVIHNKLIEDALYLPFKDIISYESNKGILTRICQFTYCVGQTVSNCQVHLMIALFVALCKLNSIKTPDIDSNIIEIFCKAYNKQIHPNAFESYISNIVV